jgi:hypothetical protein
MTVRARTSGTALAAGVIVLVAGVVGGCSSPGSDPVATTSATGTAVSSTTVEATTGSPTATEPTSTSPPTTTGSGDAPPATAMVLPSTFVQVGQTVTDPDLGHKVTVNRIARRLPWPTGYTAQAAAFELVAVEMRWDSGTAYTSTIRAQDFAVVTGSQYPNRIDPIRDPDLTAASWPILPAELPSGQSVTGWLVFRVDPADAPSIRLDWTRPATRVSGTSTVFPKTVFSVQLLPTPSVATSAVTQSSTGATTRRS